MKKKSHGSGSDSKKSKLSTLTAENSRVHPRASNLSSKRRSEGIRAAPDLDTDLGRSYELKHWDEERTVSSPDPQDQMHRSVSQDAILRAGGNEESSKGGGFTKMWQKMKPRSESQGSNEDMTITLTSEVELSNEPASAYGSKRNSRHRDIFKQHRAAKDHKSPSPPQAQESKTSYF